MKNVHNRKIVSLAAGAAVFLALLPVVGAFALSRSQAAEASHAQTTCDGLSGRTRSVAAFGHSTTVNYNFPQDGVGHFDPTPLISTTITASQAGCIVANFSASAQPYDNHVLFQVQVDGVPMIGHAPGFLGILTPVVVDPEESDLNFQRMVAANFFARVAAGQHRVEVLFTGCCSSNPGLVQVPSAVLNLHYR